MDDSADLSLLDISGPVGSSTPSSRSGKGGRGQGRGARQSLFKLPAAPRERKNPICGICHICGKEYVRQKRLDDHLRVHALQDVNSHFPDLEKMKNDREIICDGCLDKIMAVENFGQWGPAHDQFLRAIDRRNEDWISFTSLVCERFMSALTEKFLLPSALLPIAIKVSDEILTDKDLREDFIKLLCKVSADSSENMLQCFICEFVHTLGHEIIIYMCRCIVGQKARKEIVPLQLDIEDRQVIFYCAGSTMRSFLRMGMKYPRNKDWSAIANTVNTRVKEGDGFVGVPRALQSDRAWTDIQNRKALIFIGCPAMDFFVALIQVLYTVECDRDGEFSEANVLKAVYEDPATIFLWDEMISGSLDVSLSIRFLEGTVKGFTRTYARGVAKKKLNNHLKKTFAAISLRHSIAPRQKT